MRATMLNFTIDELEYISDALSEYVERHGKDHPQHRPVLHKILKVLFAHAAIAATVDDLLDGSGDPE